MLQRVTAQPEPVVDTTLEQLDKTLEEALEEARAEFKYDVFVSHCKRIDATEDRAIW